jgi:DNA repair exonuclease SbcCD ATPase subunit
MNTESMVTLETVTDAVERLKRLNLKPTARKVREQLGGGSLSKIGLVLNEYRKANRLDIAEIDDEQMIPLRNHVRTLCETQANKLVESYKDDVEALEEQTSEMNESVEKAENKIKALEEANASLLAENQRLNEVVKNSADSQTAAEEQLKAVRLELQTALEKVAELKLRDQDYIKATNECDKFKEQAFTANGKMLEMEKQLAEYKELIKEGLISRKVETKSPRETEGPKETAAPKATEGPKVETEDLKEPEDTKSRKGKKTGK